MSRSRDVIDTHEPSRVRAFLRVRAVARIIISTVLTPNHIRANLQNQSFPPSLHSHSHTKDSTILAHDVARTFLLPVFHTASFCIFATEAVTAVRKVR